MFRNSRRRISAYNCYRPTSGGCSPGGSGSIRDASHTARCLRKYKIFDTDSFVGLNNLIDS